MPTHKAGCDINGFTDALRRDGEITWRHVRHEEAAGFAAAAEAALTGQLAVCAGSCGPGNLHLINGLFDANRSRVPVLAIAAHIPREEIGSGYFQETHPERLLEKVHLQFLTRTGKPQDQARVPEAGRFDKPHVITRALEGELDVLGDLRQRGVVPGGKVQVLRWEVQDLMCSECVSSGQQQAVPLKDRQPVQQDSQVSGRQPVQAHREADEISCRSHSRRACGPSSRRNRGHMLTSDSRGTNCSRSSRCASARSSAYRTRRWSS